MVAWTEREQRAEALARAYLDDTEGLRDVVMGELTTLVGEGWEVDYLDPETETLMEAILARLDVIEARGKRLEAGLLGDPSAGSIGLVRRVELMERKQDQRFDKLETEHRREQARLDTWIKREDTEHNVLRFLGRSILGLAGASVALFTWLVSQAQK